MSRSAFCFVVILLVLVGTARPACAITFNVTFDPSTSTAPPAFFTAVNNVVQFFQAIYTDPITINLHVGWGDVDGMALDPGALGESITSGIGVSYASLKAALVSDAKTPDDSKAVANLPSADPASGTQFFVSTSEAKALGLFPANSSGTDGWVGFDNTATYTFDPNNRTVNGAFDFIGVMAHEMTEVMGRISGFASPLDLFRYSSPGVEVINPVSGPANYFSIDGGVTAINTFNSTNPNGDLGDWEGATFDSFNASSGSGHAELVSDGDLIVMDALGYDRVIKKRRGQITSSN
jgi:hypothetical protein